MVELWVNQAMSLSGAQALFLLTLSAIVLVGIVLILKGDNHVQP